MASVIYYTSNRLDPKIMSACQHQLRKAFDGEIIAVSLQPIDFGDKRIVLDLEPGYLSMFTQILAGLEASTDDVIFHAEHDVLYPKEHFDFVPPDKNKFYYDLNWFKTRKDGFAVSWKAVQVSGLCCYRQLAIDFYRERIRNYDENSFDRKFEPTVDARFETWEAAVPHVDIRHGTNTTYNKWHIQHFRDRTTAVDFKETTIEQIPGWSLTAEDMYG